MLVALTETINSNLDLGQVLLAVTDTGTKISGAAFGACVYEGGEQGRVHVSGGDGEAFAEMAAPVATALSETGFAAAETVLVDDLLTDPRTSGMPRGHLRVRSYLATPVVSRNGEVIGSLVIGHPEPGVFTPESGLAHSPARAM